MPDYSDPFKEAYASAPSNLVHLETIELRNPDFTNDGITFDVPIRIVKDNAALTATLEVGAPKDAGTSVTFTPLFFDLSLPESSDEPDPQLSISLDNVSGLLTPYLKAATTSSNITELTYRAFLFSTDDGSIQGPDGIIHLEVRGVAANMGAATISASLPNAANMSFPRELISAKKFPGLG